MSVRLAALTLIAVLAGCGQRHTCPVAPVAAAPRPLLWRVSGPQGSLVIQATHQGTGAADISALAWSELARAKVYVTEAAEPDAVRDANYDWHGATHVKGSLRARLGGHTFSRLVFLLDTTEDQLIGLKPWVAFMLLGREAYAAPAPAMTEALFARATELGTAMVFLDTWGQQVAYLDATITPAKLAAAIDNYEDLGCQLQFRVGSFRAGSDTVFANDVTDKETSARSLRWSVQLGRMLDRGAHAFVAIGIGHLVGRNGALQALSKAGYRVERL